MTNRITSHLAPRDSRHGPTMESAMTANFFVRRNPRIGSWEVMRGDSHGATLIMPFDREDTARAYLAALTGDNETIRRDGIESGLATTNQDSAPSDIYYAQRAYSCDGPYNGPVAFGPTREAAIAALEPASIDPAPTTYAKTTGRMIIREVATVDVESIGPVEFKRPSNWHLGERLWNVDFRATVAGREYWGTVYNDGSVQLYGNSRNRYGHVARTIPETAKTAWRAALAKAGLRLIREAKQQRAAFIDAGDVDNARRVEQGLAPKAIDPAPATVTATQGGYLASESVARDYCAAMFAGRGVKLEAFESNHPGLFFLLVVTEHGLLATNDAGYVYIPPINYWAKAVPAPAPAPAPALDTMARAEAHKARLVARIDNAYRLAMAGNANALALLASLEDQLTKLEA